MPRVRSRVGAVPCRIAGRPTPGRHSRPSGRSTCPLRPAAPPPCPPPCSARLLERCNVPRESPVIPSLVSPRRLPLAWADTAAGEIRCPSREAMDGFPQHHGSPDINGNGPPPKRFKALPEDPVLYSNAVRRKYATASRTGQACDRCSEWNFSSHERPCTDVVSQRNGR